jgi:hypothetical protein
METITKPARTRDGRGRYAKRYELTYSTIRDGAEVRVAQTLTAEGVERIGRLVSRAGDRGEAWDIAVRDAAGVDVTFDFGCFR